jgi:hypothetical protein
MLRASPLRAEVLAAVDGRALLGGGGDIGSGGGGGGGNDDDDGDGDGGWLSLAAVAEQFRLGPLSNSADGGESSPRLLPPLVLNPHESHGWRPAVIGCALSHLKAWRAIVASPLPSSSRSESSGSRSGSRSSKSSGGGGGGGGGSSGSGGGGGASGSGGGSPYDAFLVLEDDAVLAGDFAARFNATMAKANAHFGWDILFLGKRALLVRPRGERRGTTPRFSHLWG